MKPPAPLAVALALAGTAAALNSVPHTISLLPSDPMLMYNPGRGRWGDSERGGWNLTYDGLQWGTYEPGQEWSDKTRFALSPNGGEVRVPVSGTRISVEGTSPDNAECDVVATVGDASDKYTFKKGDMGNLQTSQQQPFAFYQARIQPQCKNYAVVGFSFDTLVNVSQKSVEAATQRTETFIGDGDQLTSFFEQSGNVGIATHNDSSVASVPNLGWVSFTTPQYASLVTIRGISCWNCSQFVVQMNPRPDGMEEKPLLDSYSPFTGPATMFVTPLDPGTQYTFNLTGIHGSGGADSLLLKNVEFVLSANDGKGSNAGLIAGVVVGVVCGLALVGALLWFCLWRRRKPSDKMTHMNDGSVVDLTHGQIAQVYPSYASRAHHRPAPESTTSAMALGELPAFAPPAAAYAGSASPSTTHGSQVFATPLQSPFSPAETPGTFSQDSPYGAPHESPFYPHSQAPSSPEHPSTDIPRAQINDLDDYFQARDSYMEGEWEDAEEHDEFDEPRKGEPSRPPPAARALPVTQEQDAGRLVALPRPQSAALPEYRPSSQYVAGMAHVEPNVQPNHQSHQPHTESPLGRY